MGMLELFKSVKTWIFIGLLVGLGGGMIFYYNNYNESLIDNGKIITENTTLKENIEYQEWSSGITDQVVKEFVAEKVTNITTTQQTRKEAIDEYIKDIDKTSVTKGTADAVPEPSSTARVSQLAERMQQLYCTARTEDPRCNPVSPAD